MTFDALGILTTCPSCGTKNRFRYERLGRAMRCARCHAGLAGLSSPIEIPDAQTFDRLLSAAPIPLIVDFWAPWCGPCRMMAPELDKVARRRAGQLLAVKVNTDVHQDLGERFRIRSIPTAMVFRGGREVARVAGVRSADDLDALVFDAHRDRA